ncbi:MAG: alpha/beta hydrolase [Verrucomicrobiae bacterium]|nr:alpha/beta hydrolase [Verrucomicrobiae bacterium]
MSIKAYLALAFSLVLSSGNLPAQELAPKVDVVYGKEDTKAQSLDVYLAKSDTPTPVMIYIHGGGWRAGSKAKIPGFLAQGVAKGWFSVVSVEYRFTDVAPHPAQVNDCVRAVQFVRQHASEWNIDPKRVGVTGGSAGAHLSLWVALHDDAADPDAEDPVQRQSSRVSCVISFAGPTDWQLLSEIEHKHPAYRQLLGYEPGTPAAEMSAELKKDVSPITFVSKDDPPVLLVHGDADDIVPIRHAQVIDEKLDAAGVPSELFIVEGANHGVAGAGGDAVANRTLDFIKEHLQIKDAE